MPSLLRLPRLILALLGATVLAGCPTSGDDDDSVAVNCDATNRPTLVIVSPDTASLYESGDSINWALTVTDPDTPIEDVDIEIVDVSDSTSQPMGIEVPVPNAQGQTNFTMSADELAEGSNAIRVVVTDPDGCTVNDQILLCLDSDTCP